MAIEIIPKPKIKEISWLKITLYTLVALFLAFLLSYLFLIFYQGKLQEQFSDLQTKLSRTPAETELERNILAAKRRIEDFNLLAASHRLPSQIFAALEQSTHPEVWFPDFKLNLEQEEIRLEGVARNFEVLGQQLLIFEKQSFIKNAVLSEVAVSREGEVDFEVQLIFDPGTLGR